MMIVYLTTNKVNGKVYVGKYCGSNPHYLGSGTLIKCAIAKYGYNNFERITLQICSTYEELNEAERYWIKKYNSQDKTIGYNIAKGGRGGNIYTNLTEKEKEAQRELNRQLSTGRKHTEESKQKMKDHSARIWLGKKQPREMVDKRANSLRGRPSKKKGRSIPDETKKKISQNHARYWLGKKVSEEERKRLSQIAKEADHSHLYRHYILLDIQSNVEYTTESVTKFIQDHPEISKTSFYRLIRGEIKTLKKKWKYVGELDRNENDSV